MAVMKQKILVVFLMAILFVSASFAGTVKFIFIYSPNCNECREIKNDYLPSIINKFPSIEYKYLDIHLIENFNLLIQLEKKFGDLKKPPPAIFIGKKVLEGKDQIKKQLEPAILNYTKSNGCDWPDADIVDVTKPVDPKQELLEKFKYLGITSIILAGLADGINPCAFSTIIIFVLYLTFTGRKRSEIFAVGLIFAAAVFIAYLSIGFGLFSIVQKLAPLLNKIILMIFGIGSLIFAMLNFYDYYKIKKGELKGIILQLPEKFKERIKLLIWKKTNKQYLFISTFIIGLLIGLIEFPCTGQIYFPIIMALREVPSLRINAFFYLVLYNLMFIIPLLVIFGFVFWGTTSDSLIKAIDEYASVSKIVLGTVFLIFGLFLIFAWVI